MASAAVRLTPNSCSMAETSPNCIRLSQWGAVGLGPLADGDRFLRHEVIEQGFKLVSEFGHRCLLA